jgi:DNA invertase Pin-like site-specific DNA recombinase
MGKIGYARVSTTDQDLSLQLATLTAAGCGVIRSEKITGSTVTGRAELRTVLDFIGKGDTLVVTRIDRLARSLGDLQDIVRELKAKGASLVATEQPIDTGTAAGKAFLDMLGVFAEFETNLRRERQMEGIAKAKAAGVYKGGKTRIATDEVRRLAGEGMGPSAIARQLGIGRASVYRLLSPGKVVSQDDRRPLDVPL